MAKVDLAKIELWRSQVVDTEVTDPGTPLSNFAEDEYIPPQEATSPKLAPAAWAPIRWVQTLLANRRVQEEAGELIAKIGKLPTAPDDLIRYFFDNDLSELVALSRLQPMVVQQMLRESFNKMPNKQACEPWFRLVQVACGDASAILPALDSLC